MEVMEEGNLMDRTRILLQRDSEHYNAHQMVLQENLCAGVVGGILDFPHYASFAAVKLVLWWEQEYFMTFRKSSRLFESVGGRAASMSDEGNLRGCGGVATAYLPQTLAKTLAESSEQLLEHLHGLTQEALDHADLTVLTGTLGAAALIRNCIWMYHQHLFQSSEGISLSSSYKSFQEMAEALAERLLDLHIRLISLYVLQDADCLDWKAQQSFFEKGRSSFTVQMWWLYMQGTQESLWNTVPPRTAQRVLGGMLNESLTILTFRYSQAQTSVARNELLVADISNLLQCIQQLLLCICTTGEELSGMQLTSNVIRDVHAKANLLFQILMVRGAPLSILYKVFNRGIQHVKCFSQEAFPDVQPWFRFVVTSQNKAAFHIANPSHLHTKMSIFLELSVLLTQPQPSWPLLLKVLTMRNCWLAATISAKLLQSPVEIGGVGEDESTSCSGFLCSGDCHLPKTSVEFALVYIVMKVGNLLNIQNFFLGSTGVFRSHNSDWSHSFHNSLVWNQKRTPWVEAILSEIYPSVDNVVPIINQAIQNSMSVEDTIKLAMTSLSEILDCLPANVFIMCEIIANQLPAHVMPIADCVLAHLLIVALYTQMVHSLPENAYVCEALCHLTEHDVLDLINAISQFDVGSFHEDEQMLIEDVQHIHEVQVSKLLLNPTGRIAVKVMYEYLKQDYRWLRTQLGQPPLPENSNTLLYKMFHIDSEQYDQFLAGKWSPDWVALLNSPLGISKGKMWEYLNLRAEFWSEEELSEHDSAVVAKLRALFADSR
nr:PREDICTED: uncharacterized protein LOC109030520 [Bemisia tabaci]